MDSSCDKDLYLHVNNHIVLRIKDNLTLDELEDSLTFIRSVLTPMIKAGTLSSNLPHKPPERNGGGGSNHENSYSRGSYGSGNPFSTRYTRRSNDGYGDSIRGQHGRRFRNSSYRGSCSGLGNCESTSPDKGSRLTSDSNDCKTMAGSYSLGDQAVRSYGVAANDTKTASSSPTGNYNSFCYETHLEDQPKSLTTKGDQPNGDNSNNVRKRCRMDEGENLNAALDTSTTTRPPSDEGDDLDWIPKAVLKIESNLIECSDSDEENS